MDSPVLTGSRMANAIGLGWESPLAEWGRMVGDPGFPPQDDTEAMRLGRRLQPIIFDELNVAGYPCVEQPHPGSGWGYVDPEREWLQGHPDGFGVESLDGIVVETKCQGFPHPDMSALVQLHTYIHLGGYAGGLLATFANLKVDVLEIERDDETIGRILALAETFMQYVWEKREPPHGGHPDDGRALGLLHPHSTTKKIRETPAVKAMRRELQVLRDQDKPKGPRTRRKEYLEAGLKQHMGDAGELVSAQGETVAKWTRYESSRTDWKGLATAHGLDPEPFTTTTQTGRLTLT